MTMPNLYKGLLPQDAFLEYSLELLTQCLNPQQFDDAYQSLNQLKKMLVIEQAAGEFVAAVEHAEIKLNSLCEAFGQGARPFTDEYNRPLSELRDILLVSAERYKTYLGG